MVCPMEGNTYHGAAAPAVGRKQRNALRRAQKRADERGEEFVDDRITCALCERNGRIYQAFNLSSHISKVHGISVTDYERQTGQPEGRGQIVAPSASHKLKTAGAKGALKTQALLRSRAEAARAAMLEQEPAAIL